jgi:hypothetical protein
MEINMVGMRKTKNSSTKFRGAYPEQPLEIGKMVPVTLRHVDGSVIYEGTHASFLDMLEARAKDYRSSHFADLRGQKLSGLAVTNVGFSNSDFTDAALCGALFSSCILSRSILKAKSMNNTVFTNCSIESADFSGVNLEDTKFVDCALYGSSFRGARVSRGTFSNCIPMNPNLVGAIFSTEDSSLDDEDDEDDTDEKMTLGLGMVSKIRRTDGYDFLLLHFLDGRWMIAAGCRFFTMEKAEHHWKVSRGGTPLGRQTMAILELFKTLIEQNESDARTVVDSYNRMLEREARELEEAKRSAESEKAAEKLEIPPAVEDVPYAEPAPVAESVPAEEPAADTVPSSENL